MIVSTPENPVKSTPSSAKSKALKQTTLSLRRQSPCKAPFTCTAKENMDNSNFDPAKAMHLQPAEQLDLKTQTPLPLQESRAVNNAASNFPRQSQGDIKFWQPPVCHGSTGPQSSIAACSDEKIISNLIDASRVSGSSNCLEDEKSRINRSARKRLLEEPPSIRVSGKRQMPKSVGIVPQAGGNMPVPEAEPKQPLAYLDYSCHGRIQYSSHAGEIEDICANLLHMGVKETGWDIEWRATYRTGEPPRKTALMQICYQLPGGSYSCLLFHVFFSGLPPSLRLFLTNPIIAKAGVRARADAHKVGMDFDIEIQGVAELSDHPVVRADETLQSRSLASLTEKYMHLGLMKDAVRMSNWETRVLSYEQQMYAANDAFASLRLYQILQAMPPPALTPAPCQKDILPQLSLPPETDRVWIPGLAETRPLQPAKKAVYNMIVIQGLCFEAVASVQRIKLSSVAGYFADAIISGHGYFWPTCDLSLQSLKRLQESSEELLRTKGVNEFSSDILCELQCHGITLKRLQDHMKLPLDSARIRLGLAHIGRERCRRS